MDKLTKWEKVELINLYKTERKELRCGIVQGLSKQANALTIDVRAEIDKVKEQLFSLENAYEKILSDNRLCFFDGSKTYPCRTTSLHESLIVFDNETNIEIQKIIREE